MNHRRGREGLPVHVSIAQLLEPTKISHSAINRARARHTVKGRTLIATLMDEAPSVAAMMARQIVRTVRSAQ